MRNVRVLLRAVIVLQFLGSSRDLIGSAQVRRCAMGQCRPSFVNCIMLGGVGGAGMGAAVGSVSGLVYASVWGTPAGYSVMKEYSDIPGFKRWLLMGCATIAGIGMGAARYLVVGGVIGLCIGVPGGAVYYIVAKPQSCPIFKL